MSARGGRTLRISITRACNVVAPAWLPEGDDLPGLAELDAWLKRQGALDGCEVVLSGGEPLLHPRLPEFAARLREEGAGRVTLATNAMLLAAVGRAEFLERAGVGGLEVLFLSPSPLAYSRLTRVARSLETQLAGLKRALAAGLAVDVVVPLIGAGATDLARSVQVLARLRAGATGVRQVRFEYPGGDAPWPLRPEHPALSLEAIRDELVAALRAARAAGMDAPLGDRCGIPACTLVGHPDLLDAFRFDPRRVLKPDPGFVKGEQCAACAHQAQCHGVRTGYARLFGTTGLAPIAQRLPGLAGDRLGSERRAWDEESRDHARESRLKILRLTLACNQRCVFCPTDGTSETIVTDQRERLRQLQRWAANGVTWVSFSGGEPTLVRELPGLIRVARDLGIRDRELVTNAVRLADPAYLNRLLEAGLNRLFVSLHAHRAELSDALTGRPGDFEQTLAGLTLALQAGLCPTINHVLCSENYKEIKEFVAFVADRLGTRASVTLAFITPLYLAAQRTELIPRIPDVMPYLHPALDLARERELDLVVLSRPGIPPCFLGPRYLNHSDLPRHVHRIRSEDLHKKAKSPACQRCMYDTLCAGVWKAYAALHGLDELKPIEL